MTEIKTKTSFEKKILTNSIWGILAKLVAMIFYVVTDVVLARRLGKPKYGEWSYFYSIACVAFVLVRFGVNGSIQTYIASEHSQERQSQVIKGGTILRSVISIVVSLLTGITMVILSPRLGYPDKYPDLRMLFLIFPLLIFGNTVVDFFKNVCAALQDIRKQFVFTLIEYFGIFLAALSLLLVNDIKVLMIGYTSAYLLSSLFCGVQIRDRLKAKALNEDIKKIFLYALTLLATNVISELLMEMDTFMLGLMTGPEEVSVYSIAKSLTNKGTNFSLAIASSTMATFAIIDGHNVIEKRKTYKRLCYANFGALILISIALFLLGNVIISILYGAQFIDAYDSMVVLIPYLVMFSMSVFPAMFLGYRKMASKP